MQSETKWYAQTLTGRTGLKARTNNEAVKEVEGNQALRKVTYAIVKIDMTVVKEYPANAQTGRPLRRNIHG